MNQHSQVNFDRVVLKKAGNFTRWLSWSTLLILGKPVARPFALHAQANIGQSFAPHAFLCIADFINMILGDSI